MEIVCELLNNLPNFDRTMFYFYFHDERFHCYVETVVKTVVKLFAIDKIQSNAYCSHFIFIQFQLTIYHH